MKEGEDAEDERVEKREASSGSEKGSICTTEEGRRTDGPTHSDGLDPD